MYESIQFICKVVMFSGVMIFISKVYDTVTYKREIFIIDGVSSVDVGILEKERVECRQSKECSTMALTIYHEARGEGWNGMKAVANVIKNRVESPKFKGSVKEVVERPWQFSYVHEVKDKSPKDLHSYKQALIISKRVLTGEIKDNTMGSTHYLAPKKIKKMPRWAREFERTVVINNHTFYRG
jgi:spore germination cell wall hydrolase CwlJ-like protein